MQDNGKRAACAVVATIAVLTTMHLALGCASKEVQPRRTLRELYELQAEVNKNADPYDMGTGAAPSRVNHERARDQGEE